MCEDEIYKWNCFHGHFFSFMVFHLIFNSFWFHNLAWHSSMLSKHFRLHMDNRNTVNHGSNYLNNYITNRIIKYVYFTRDCIQVHFISPEQIMSMYALQRRITDSNVTISSLHPGVIETNIQQGIMDNNTWFGWFNRGLKMSKILMLLYTCVFQLH